MGDTQKTGKRGKKKMALIILGIILAIILTIVIIISCIANSNVKVMNRCLNEVLNELQANYTLTPCDVGEYEELKMFGIVKFNVEQYEIEELGNLSLMNVNMGFMQMATIVITPKDKNMPLLSADYMYMLTNRMSYLEFYDLVTETDDSYLQLQTSLSAKLQDYAHLENASPEPAWYTPMVTVGSYKNGKGKDDQDLQNMLTDCLKIYLEHAKTLPTLSAEEQAAKKEITLEYTDGLIEKGGISTDVFKKELGEEKTKHFFDTVFFGTGNF